MRKMSKEAERRNWAALEKLADARDDIAMEVMREVFARLPFGQKFTLSDGSVAHLSKFVEPELCANESSEYYQRPHFGVDVVIEGGKLDHVEISAFQTGAGMAVDPTIAGAKASTDAQTPEEPGKWTASRGRKTAGHSESLVPRTRPRRAEGERSSGR
jgi:hypothetical protein